MKYGTHEVYKVIRNSQEISRIYKGANLVYRNDVHPDILLEYIANGADSTGDVRGNVYFDTGVKANNNIKVEFKYNIPRLSGNACLIGCQQTSSNRYYILTYAGLGYKDVLTNKFWYNSVPCGYEDGSPTLNTPHTVTAYAVAASSGYDVKYVYDGTTYTHNGNAGTISTTASMYILAQNNAGSAQWFCQRGTKIYYVKIWNGSTLIRDYEPVLHYINNAYVPAFCNTLNQSYIYNLGTDTPTYSLLNN